MRWFATFFLLAVWVAFPLSLDAQGNSDKQFEVYPVGIGDYETILSAVKAIASPDGKVIADAAHQRIIVIDKPEVHQKIRNVIDLLQIPQKNVRIKVRFEEHSTGAHQEFGARETIKMGNVTVTPVPKKTEEGLRVKGRDDSFSSTSLTQQELLVVNNGSASLEVATEIPYYQWIYNFGVAQGLWTAETEWRSVGAKLCIKPTIIGNTIRIKLTPELSALVHGKPDVISMETLSTEVIAVNGEEISLGGVPAQFQEFYSKFLVGYDNFHRVRSLNIYLTPVIEDPVVLK